MADDEKRQEIAVWFLLLLVSGVFVMALLADPQKQGPRTPVSKAGDEAFAKLFGLETCSETVRAGAARVALRRPADQNARVLYAKRHDARRVVG